MKREKIVLGRTDTLDFPKLGLSDIKVKIDTGAYTSSFHCHNINIENGKLKCQFLDPSHEQYHDTFFVFEEFEQLIVKSSNGISEERFAVRTNIRVFGKIFPIKLTLTERGSMKFPVLLGRKFLSKKFIIDTAKKNLSYKAKLKQL